MIEDITIRDFGPDDIPFIFSTWLKCYKHQSYFAKRIRYDTFFEHHHKIVDDILNRESISVKLAVLKDDESLILGYVAFEQDKDTAIHFLFVKQAFRRMGIARALLNELDCDLNGVTFSHWTYDFDHILRKYPEMQYNPYLAFKE